MKRRSFFATLAAIFVAPKVIKSEPVVRDNSYALQYAKSIHEQSTRSEGELIVKDGYVIINEWDEATARVGDTLLTTVTGGNCLRVVSIKIIGGQSTDEWRKLFQYKCHIIHRPKQICGRHVIMINGKYKQFKQRDPIEVYKINLRVIGRPFQEGGV